MVRHYDAPARYVASKVLQQQLAGTTIDLGHRLA
jgi:hypothetical protein